MVCEAGQTHTIGDRYGLDQLLAGAVEMVHGPGCPVCVTSLETIDRAHAIAARPDVTLASFGDMLRVPGSHGDLLSLRAQGADVRVVYSPLDALQLAIDRPDREVVFLGIGFETTAPANAMAVRQAAALGVRNFSMLVSHVLVPPAIAAMLEEPDCTACRHSSAPGTCAHDRWASTHASTWRARRQMRYRVPRSWSPASSPSISWRACCSRCGQLELAGRAEVENQYTRSVKRDGLPAARALLDEVFEVEDRKWRGLGAIAGSGFRLRAAFAALRRRARRFVARADRDRVSPSECMSGQVLRGHLKPCDCPSFGTRCTPDTPLGATMVSNVGACAAYFQYRRRDAIEEREYHGADARLRMSRRPSARAITSGSATAAAEKRLHRRADRAGDPARARQRDARAARRPGGCSPRCPRAARVSRSRRTRSWSVRSSFRAATLASWRSTARGERSRRRRRWPFALLARVHPRRRPAAR